MILHVTHGPGSNGSAYTGTPEHLATVWRKIVKTDPSARCHFFKKPGGLQCRAASGGGYCVGLYFDGAHKTRNYEYLLPALKRVEKGAAQ